MHNGGILGPQACHHCSSTMFSILQPLLSISSARLDCIIVVQRTCCLPLLFCCSCCGDDQQVLSITQQLADMATGVLSINHSAGVREVQESIAQAAAPAPSTSGSGDNSWSLHCQTSSTEHKTLPAMLIIA